MDVWSDNILMGTREENIERKSEQLQKVRNKDELRHGFTLDELRV